jgi:hypothetical protein
MIYNIKPPFVSCKDLYRSWDLSKEEPGGNLDGVVSSVSPHRLRYPVEVMATYFRREFHYDFVQYDRNWRDDNPGDRAYIWTENDWLVNDRVPVIGAVSFRQRTSHYALQWIWIHPFQRNRCRLTMAWSYFLDRFGDFKVEGPLSHAMEGFLKKEEALK